MGYIVGPRPKRVGRDTPPLHRRFATLLRSSVRTEALVTFDAVSVAQTRRQVAHLVALGADLPPPLLAFLPGEAITEVVGRWVVVGVRFCVGRLGRTGERPAQISGFVSDLLEGVPGDVLRPAGHVIAVVESSR